MSEKKSSENMVTYTYFCTHWFQSFAACMSIFMYIRYKIPQVEIRLVLSITLGEVVNLGFLEEEKWVELDGEMCTKTANVA